MTNSYETIDLLRKQKIKIGNSTYIINAHFLERGETLQEKIINLITSEVKNFTNYTIGEVKKI